MATRANWAWHHGDGPPSERAVVFDIDGVLADAAGRQHFLDGSRKNWDAFFAACGEDPLIGEVARLLDLLASDLTVVLLTGRPMSVQEVTMAWLRRNHVRWDLLVMRDAGDYTSALSFKRRTITELRDAGFDLELAFEDDRRNADMFHSEGVPCVYIHSGYYG